MKTQYISKWQVVGSDGKVIDEWYSRTCAADLAKMLGGKANGITYRRVTVEEILPCDMESAIRNS